MKRTNLICFCFLFTLSVLSSISCGGGTGDTNSDNTNIPDNTKFSAAVKSDSPKIIHTFEFSAENNSDYLSSDIIGTIKGNIITLRIPRYTNRASLIPTITFSGESITPESGEAVNFKSGNVKYTVRAPDGTRTDYKIIVRNQQWIKSVEYRPAGDQVMDPDNDEITGYIIPEFFKDGTSRYTKYISGGKDKIWFNADDDIDYVNVYNSAGDFAGRYLFNNPGPDGKYQTKDDVYDSYTLDIYDENGNRIKLIEGNTAGSDGIWLTEDDGFSVLQLFDYENNLLTRQIQYSDKDTVSFYYLYKYNEDSEIDTEWKYIGPGFDGNWFTEDDELLTEKTYRYDSAGNISRETVSYYNYGNVSYWYSYAYNRANKITGKIEYDKKGYDNTWFTDDDIIYSKEIHKYNKYGQETLTIDSDSPGPDKTWFNSDDDINSYTVFEYTGSSMVCTYYYWPNNRIGPDGKWFTSDDIPWYKTYILYNIIKNVKKDQEIFITSYGAGSDGLWFTADDVNLNSYMRNRFDKHGNFLGTTYYCGAGNDGIWLTDDDVIDYYDVYIYK